MQKARRLVVCLAAVSLMTATCERAHAEGKARSKKVWLASVAALAAANLVDAWSSHGRYEANPLLRNGQGRFDVRKGIIAKSASSGAAIAVQLLLCRTAREENLYKTSAAVNFASAAGLSALAVRNFRIPKAE